MKIRRIAVIFALLSAVYWETVRGIVEAIALLRQSVAPYWEVVLTAVLPGMIYALISLLFCHWLARRVVRMTLNRKEPN